FDRDEALCVVIPGFVDTGHTASGDMFTNFVPSGDQCALKLAQRFTSLAAACTTPLVNLSFTTSSNQGEYGLRDLQFKYTKNKEDRQATWDNKRQTIYSSWWTFA